MAITITITKFSGAVPDRQNDTPIVFAKNVYDYQVWIDTYFVKELNSIINEVNTTALEVQSNANLTQTNVNTAITKAADAEAAAVTAISAKHSIELNYASYIDDTTYSEVSIDVRVNALAPNSGYLRVSKKLDNFVFPENANFLNKVADKTQYIKFGDKVVDTHKHPSYDVTLGGVVAQSQVPEVTEVITDGSNTTSVSVNAGDYVVDGSELVTNGAFDTDTSGWSTGTGTINNTSNKLNCVNGSAWQELTNLIIGQTYQLIFDYDRAASTYDGEVVIYSGTGAGAVIANTGLTLTADKRYTLLFTATETSHSVTCMNYANANTTVYDNISVKRVSDTFRAKQLAPVGTALTDTAYFEDRTHIGITSQLLDNSKRNTTTKAYEGKVPELLLTDVSKADLLNNPSWLASNGFSKASQYLYTKSNYEYIVSGIYQTLNTGIYNPFHNPFGTKKASDDKYWNDTAVSFTSVADCFDASKLLTASGNVASGKSGRPVDDITPYYDVCYSSLYQDIREYAKLLNQDEVKLIWDDKEENGVEDSFGILSSSLLLDIEFLGDSAYYPTTLNDIIASELTPKLTFNTIDDRGVNNAFDGVKTSFKLLKKMTANLQVLKSTDSGATWSVQTVTADYNANSITFATAPLATDIILVSSITKNQPYTQSNPLTIISVDDKVIASNSHSIYRGALIGNQVSGKIQVGNGYESKVLENSELDENLAIQTTPSHSALALDNSNSSASKWFKALSQGANGVVGSVLGKELAYNSGTTSFDGDNDKFDQLTNGTKTDINGNTVKTFVGHIALNAEVR